MSTSCHDVLDRLATAGPDDAPPGDWAGHYAAHGFAVLPIHPPTGDGGCSCGPGCTVPGKHPMTEHGVRDASTDLRTILTWWRFRPDANVGIVPPPGVVVLDVDPRNGGGSNLVELLDGAELTPTWTCATGGAGLHAWYRHDGRVLRTPGVDLVRGANRYVVVPPSLHASGRRYRWITGQAIADLPVALHDESTDDDARSGPSCSTQTAGRPVTRVAGTGRFGYGHGLVRTVRNATEGSRNGRLYWAACRAWEAGGDPDLIDALGEAARGAGLADVEIAATLASAARTAAGAA